jgi:hypothetical protein
MEEVLGIYERPFDERFPVVCMDETNKQLIKEVRPSLPMVPGQSTRYDAEYERVGVCNIFFSFEPLKGKRRIKVTDTRGKLDWAHFIKEIVDKDYFEATKIILILDNLNTHRGASLYEAFPPKEAKRILDRLEIHYTPNHGSWLNMAEIELSHLSRQCLDRRIPSKKQFDQEISSWIKKRNSDNCTIDWRFTASDARIKLKKLYPTLINGQNC